jgi:cell division protein ZapA
MIKLDVTIMGQPYKLTCQKGQDHVLREAVAYLDEKMCVIRDAGKIKGNDRIAVMASLEMAVELLMTKVPQGPLSDLTMSEVQQKIAAMHTVLDRALAPQENLF